MEFRDYYKVLGVEAGADDAEIKKAYRRLARKYHPDVSKEADAEERFKAINEANEVLGDRERRAAYDNVRGSYREGQPFQPPPNWNGGAGAGARGAASAGAGFGQGGFDGDFSDFFETLFGQQRDFGGAGARAGPRPRAARSLRAQLTLTLDQAYQGGEQRLSLNGRSYDVRIPAGIASGQVIRLAGQAPGGGDVLLEVNIAPDPRFLLEGRNTIGTVRLMPWQAALGARLPVATLGGHVQLTIPAGSQSGRRLRLKGRGLPGSPPGDHFIQLEVQVPVPDNDDQRAAYQALAQAFDDDASAT